MSDGYFADSYWASDYFASGYWGSGASAAAVVTVELRSAEGRRQRIKPDTRKQRLKQLVTVLTEYYLKKQEYRRQTS